MNKTKKIVISTTCAILAITFLLRVIAIDYDLSGLKSFFDLQNATDSSWYIVSCGLSFIIGLMIWDDSKIIKVIAMIPLFGYGLLQFIFIMITLLFVGGGFDDGFVFVDICRYIVTMLLSFIPAAILADSLEKH